MPNIGQNHGVRDLQLCYNYMGLHGAGQGWYLTRQPQLWAQIASWHRFTMTSGISNDQNTFQTGILWLAMGDGCHHRPSDLSLWQLVWINYNPHDCESIQTVVCVPYDEPWSICSDGRDMIRPVVTIRSEVKLTNLVYPGSCGKRIILRLLKAPLRHVLFI